MLSIKEGILPLIPDRNNSARHIKIEKGRARSVIAKSIISHDFGLLKVFSFFIKYKAIFAVPIQHRIGIAIQIIRSLANLKNISAEKVRKIFFIISNKNEKLKTHAGANAIPMNTHLLTGKVFALGSAVSCVEVAISQP